MLRLIIEHFGPDVFNTESTGNGVGDCISNKKMGNVTLRDYYKYEKGKDGIIRYMTADEYIDKCIHDIFHSSYTATVTNAVNTDVINDYADKMKNGTIFPMPYLDYTINNQEGRHRALAYKQAFGDNAEFPVLEIYPTDVTNDEIYDYCERKWGNGEDWFEYVAYGLGRTEKEVRDYLGRPYTEEEPELDTQEDTTHEPIDFDDIDDLIADEIADEVESDFENDYDDTMEQLSNKCGLSVAEIENLDAIKLVQLLNKYY